MTRYWVLFFVTVVLIVAIGWTNDHRSCERQVDTRNALNYASGYFAARAMVADERAKLEPTARLAALDRQSAVQSRLTAKRLHVPELSCSALLPTVH